MHYYAPLLTTTLGSHFETVGHNVRFCKWACVPYPYTWMSVTDGCVAGGMDGGMEERREPTQAWRDIGRELHVAANCTVQLVTRVRLHGALDLG